MAEIITVSTDHPEASRIARAAELLRRGEVIALPTDTFYGLAANPFERSAVEKVFRIKGRSKSYPLLLLVDSLAMARQLALELSPGFYRLAERFWPGPLTLVVEASPQIPPEVTAHTGRIGLRLPAASLPVSLIQAAGCPITATSANRSGERECQTAQEVERSLGDRLLLILDGGPSPAARPSTVLDLYGNCWEILREGAIPSEEIGRVLSPTPRRGKTRPK